MFIRSTVNSSRIILATVLLLCLVFTLAAGQRNRFSRSWKFYLGDANGAQATTFNDGSWETVHLPHTIKEELNYRTSNIYMGVCWYRKHFTLPAELEGKIIYIEFGAAMQKAEVWINGTSVTTHLGGYTPFVIDISDKVTIDGENVIAVRLDNNPSTAFPPGKTEPDFLYFGGLYRDVYLHIMGGLHISHPLLADIPAGGGVFVTYPSATSGNVQVKTHVINETGAAQSCKVTTVIIDANGQTVATNTTTAVNINAGGANAFTQQITVSSPKLWSPDAPNLYTLHSEVFGSGDAPLDTMSTTIGIRSIAFSKSGGLQINGKRYKLQGCNRHMSYPYIGNAVPQSGQVRDARIMKEFGYDFVRMSHYYQPEEFVTACDRFGVASMACIPGWQYFNEEQIFRDASVKVLREMIRLYRNHPSVIVYEAMHNESYPTVAFLEAAQAAAHEEYPGNQMFTCGEDDRNVLDIYMSSAQHSVRDYNGSKACIISEYGDWEHGCIWSDGAPISGCEHRIERSDGEAVMLKVANNRANDLSMNRGVSWYAADGVWTIFDYQTWSLGPYTGSGDMDIFRIPKYSAFMYQSQRNPGLSYSGLSSGPMVYIASQWTNSSATTVTVYSNCEQVRLSLNGTAVATASPKIGTNLDHPPFSFTVPAFQSGNLKAEGLIGGNVAAQHTVFTPGSAAAISLTIDTAGQQFIADGSDIAIVYASIVDDNKQVIYSATSPVTFAVTGPAKLVGTNPAPAVAGIATILLRADMSSGQISVNASGPANGSASVTSHPEVESIVGISSPIRGKVNSLPTSAAFGFRHTGNMLTITGPSFANDNVTFTLYDARGRSVGTWNLLSAFTTVHLNTLAGGIYIGQITTASRQMLQKEIVRVY
ncbi:MAG: DUF4982 domain-containing protein [Chitinispirillaceae bacterium]|nr:DUF4982 domain-containing protein [Chitinispirillaceae bacterium]